jgi:hypothetical protein
LKSAVSILWGDFFMHRTNNRLAVVALALLASLGAASAARADDDATSVVRALQQTPVSLFTYGLANLHQAVNSFAGMGGSPATSPFADPFSGPIAESATVTYDSRSTAILVSLIRISKIEGEGSPEQACTQARAAFHTFVGLDPNTGQLPEGVPSSLLADTFFPLGTDIPEAAQDPATVDRLISVRYVFPLAGKHYECRGPLYGTNYTIKAFNF